MEYSFKENGKNFTVDFTKTFNNIKNNKKVYSNDGTPYLNLTSPYLPKGVAYTEWTVDIGNAQKGTMRVVIGNDGSVWFSPNHYGRDKQGNKMRNANTINTWRKLK